MVAGDIKDGFVEIPDIFFLHPVFIRSTVSATIESLKYFLETLNFLRLYVADNSLPVCSYIHRR